MIGKIKEYGLLSDHVCKAIKDAINNDQLKGEEKVSETELAKMLGVSRTPVREALRLLHSEGYIKLMPNESFVVSSFNKKDAIEVLEIRRAIESEASAMVAKTITEEQKKELINIFEQINNLDFITDRLSFGQEFVKADTAFHRYIVVMSGNSRMFSLSESLRDRLFRDRISLSSLENAKDICKEQHNEILDAIIRNDSDAAYVSSIKHINYIISNVVPRCYP